MVLDSSSERSRTSCRGILEPVSVVRTLRKLAFFSLKKGALLLVSTEIWQSFRSMSSVLQP